MKKIFVVTFLITLVALLVTTGSAYAYTMDVNEGQESFKFAPITRYLDDSSTWTVSNPSGNVYLITNISFHDDIPNYQLNLDDVYRATFSGKEAVFPLQFASNAVGYSLNINKNSTVLYGFFEKAGYSTDFYDTTSMIYSYMAGYDFGNNVPVAINVNDLKINLTVHSNGSMTNQDVKDFASLLFSRIWVYWQQSYDYYGIDFGTSDYNDGYEQGRLNGYFSGYSEAREQYARFHQGMWQTADEAYNNGYAQGTNESYAIGYDDGYNNGVAVTEPQAYDEGYQNGFTEGIQDAFMNSIQYWFPSAILLVLIGGGILYMIKRKNGVE